MTLFTWKAKQKLIFLAVTRCLLSMCIVQKICDFILFLLCTQGKPFLGCHIWTIHFKHESVMPRMNEWSHVWMSHIIYDSVISCIWMSYVTYKWVMSRMNESRHVETNHFTYEWVMSHTNESYHVIRRMKELCHHKNDSCHVWSSQAMNELCHRWMSRVTYAWVMSHTIETYQMRKRHVWTVNSRHDEWLFFLRKRCHCINRSVRELVHRGQRMRGWRLINARKHR